jgi:hypothetical protein
MRLPPVIRLRTAGAAATLCTDLRRRHPPSDDAGRCRPTVNVRPRPAARETAARTAWAEFPLRLRLHGQARHNTATPMVIKSSIVATRPSGGHTVLLLGHVAQPG